MIQNEQITRRGFVDHERVHARKIAFYGTLLFTGLMLAVISAVLGGNVWAWLAFVGPLAVAIALMLALLVTRE